MASPPAAAAATAAPPTNSPTPPSPPSPAAASPPQSSSSNSTSPMLPSQSPPPPSSSPPPPAQPPPSSPQPSTPSSFPPLSMPPSSASPPPTPTSSSPPMQDASPPPPPSKDGSTSKSPPAEEDQAPPPPTSSTSTPPPSNTNTPTPSVAGSPPPPTSSGTAASTGSIIASPPPPAHKSSPSSSSSSLSPTSSNAWSPVATTVAIGFGVVALILMMAVFCVVCSARKRKKKTQAMQYYIDPSLDGPKGGGGEYYSGQHPNSWNNQNHVMGVPPPPSAMKPPQSWGSGPPTSGEMLTSGNFSGGTPLPPPSPKLSMGFNQSTFTYQELAAATDGFAQSNLLGQGGFGFVHKGTLPNGKEIAVKSLKSGSGQGEREFQAEVEIISRVHHRHLVSLVGYCIADGRRMLVYEFVANNTLEYHLHGKGATAPMEWPTRLRIALGSAKGLAYLHEDCHPRIIHRDIKAANILLDFNYEAMVADFGLAKLSSDNYTHVSTRVMGTFGYLAPEYASSGKLSEKSDVFSFGVMLLELITGRRPVDVTNTYMEDSLVDWARPILTRTLEDGNFDELVDPRLDGNFNPHELACMASCAAAAVRHSAKRRPKMSQIARALEGDATLDDLSEGVKPGQCGMYGSNGSTTNSYDTNVYNADMQKFRQVVMSSQEFNSSEYGGTTSEYANNPSSTSSDSQDWKRSPLPKPPGSQ